MCVGHCPSCLDAARIDFGTRIGGLNNIYPKIHEGIHIIKNIKDILIR